MNQKEEGTQSAGFLDAIDKKFGYKALRENWVNLSIFVFPLILGFSLIAGFMVDQEAFFEMFRLKQYRLRSGHLRCAISTWN